MLSLSVFGDDDDDDDVLTIHMTTLVDTPSSWVQLLTIPVFEVSSRVNMMFENSKVMDNVQRIITFIMELSVTLSELFYG